MARGQNYPKILTPNYLVTHLPKVIPCLSTVLAWPWVVDACRCQV